MVDLKHLRAKEGINYDELNMINATIETVEFKDYTSSAPDSKERLRLLIQTNILKEGTKIRATEFINLFRDENDEICYSSTKGSNAQKILSFFNVSGFDELVGKDCKTIVRVNDNKKNVGIYYG